MIEMVKPKYGYLCENCFGKDDTKEINIKRDGFTNCFRLCSKCRGELIRVMLDDNKGCERNELSESD